MNTQTLTQEDPPAAAASGTPLKHDRPIVFRNSRLYCWFLMILAGAFLLLGVCMMLMAISLLIPMTDFTFMRALGALQWGLGGFAMTLGCPFMWKRARQLAGHRVTMDARGIDFSIGTRKNPVQLFMEWSDLASIEQTRVGNAQQISVKGKDGSLATFSSSTFLRPKKIARLIAERAGLTIQQA
jgi:hypothetical protein